MKRSSTELSKSAIQESAEMEGDQHEGGEDTTPQGAVAEKEVEDEGGEKVEEQIKEINECGDKGEEEEEVKEGGKVEEEKRKIGECGDKEEEKREEERCREEMEEQRKRVSECGDKEEEDMNAMENEKLILHVPTEYIKVVRVNGGTRELRETSTESGKSEEEMENEEGKENGTKEEEEAMLSRPSSVFRKDSVDKNGERPQSLPSECNLNINSRCTPAVRPFLRQCVMSLVASLSGLSNGTIYAYPAVALARWEDAGVQLTTAQKTWFVSAPLVVAMAGCVVAGVLVEWMGVRLVLLLGSFVLALTWLVLALSASFWVLILARVFQGTVASVFMVIMTAYPVEVSEVRWRGIVVSVSEIMVMLGAFCTYVGGLVMQASSLAYVLAGALIPQLLCAYFLRESPLWLARRNRMDKAAASLAWLRGGWSEEVDVELEHIKASVYIERQEEPNALKQLLLLRKMVYLKPVVLCVLVLLFKELTGQYAALTYTITMFRLAGSTLDPYLCAVVMGAARFLPSFLSWALIERLRRRLLLASGLFISSLSFATLGGVLWYWGGVEGGLQESLGWIPLACICVFTLAYGSGVGPITWTLVAELLPSQVRNVGAGILVMCFSLFLFLIGFTFPYSVESVGVGGVFLIYSLCSLVGVVFVLSCLPETKGKTFMEIQTAINPNHRIVATATSQQQESNVV